MLSILIPVGPGRDAHTALASLTKAGIQPSDEIILVGDGHAVAVPESLRSILPLHVHRIPNPAGANAVRNFAAARARHSVFCFLDDDDAYLPDALTTVRSAMEHHGDAPAASLAWRMASGRRQWCARRPARLRESNIWRRNVAGGSSSMVVRADAFHAVGGFDPSLPAMQDWDLWLRLARTAPILTIPTPGVLYHDHDGPRISTTASARIAGLAALLDRHARHWPPSVRAFHRARLAAARYKAGLGPWHHIPQRRAPLASLAFAGRAVLTPRHLSMP